MTKEENEMKPSQPSRTRSLAIIGIDCIFPKASILQAYWSNIKKRIDAITEVPDTHWSIEDFYDQNPKAPDKTYACRGGFISPVDFNPLEFAIAPNTIEATDTSQLLGLIVAGRALEDAGYGKDSNFDKKRTSVILGVTGALKLVVPLGARLGHPYWRKALEECGAGDEFTDQVVRRISDSYVEWQELSFPGLLGNVVAGRIANHLDLGGTNCVVDAACGSSLSAFNLASLELETGRSDIVITGGVDTFNDIFMYMCFSKSSALSPTGHARPFDHKCDGTIIGEGLGMIVLKRLEDAERDGDRIYAVIRGVGTSSDGKGAAIYAPKADGQKQALLKAYEQAGVNPRTIELLEAHGTGTKAGDQTEITALNEIYSSASSDTTWCAIGSVKSQIGHTKAAAGVAGLIKAALGLYYKVLPPTIKVEKPMEILASCDTPFYVNTELRPWMLSDEFPRRAAVSSFGFGGSNYHCILEEYSGTKTVIDWDNSVQIVAFSAPSAESLKIKLDSWKTPETWPELCLQAEKTRNEFFPSDQFRMVIVLEQKGASPEKVFGTAKTLLKKNAGKKNWSTPDGVYFGSGPASGPPAVLFPGQGAQYTGMLQDLACQFPMMLNTLVDADSSFAKNRSEGIKKRLSDLIYPVPVFDRERKEIQEKELRDTRVAQPALGAVCMGALHILKYFGLEAGAYAGHSYGELTALCAAGCLTPEELHKLSAVRGNLMAGRSGDLGSMLAVQDTTLRIEEVLKEHNLDLVIANKNASDQSVLSGRTDEIERAVEIFKNLGFRSTKLQVAAAFHSSIISDAQEPFRRVLDEVAFPQSKVPVYANSTGAMYPDSPDEARKLLAGQLARPVEFVREIKAIHDAGIRTFIESGPGARLTGLVKAILGTSSDYEALTLDPSQGKRGALTDLARLLANLAALGQNIKLHLWNPLTEAEKRALENKKAKMTIPISGANYVKPKDKKPAYPPVPAPARTTIQKEARTMRRNPEVRFNPGTPKPGKQSNQALSSSNDSPSIPEGADRSTLLEALRITQQNMAALQSVQEQTAHLHQQFLTNQESALQSLQALLDQQQTLVSASLGQVPSIPRGSAAAALQPVQSPTPSKPPAVAENSDTGTVSQLAETSPSRITGTSNVSGVLLDVVAEKTGYPIEMLELDMTLDSDLGIDSNKRVEIFSTLRDRVPGLQTVRSEHMDTLKTLKDIVAFAAGDTGNSPEKTPVQPGSGAVVQAPAVDVSSKLLNVIAEKTGYPIEMLELDMALDTDLGIDSIKSVEIFSALQDRIPGVKPVKPDQMGTLKTLRDIADFISGCANSSRVTTGIAGHETSKQVAASQAAEGQSHTEESIAPTLFKIISEKTGYPVEMLELDMNLDADLGIDSIKRVEIFSVLKDAVPEMPPVATDSMNTIKSLRDITGYIVQSLKKTVIDRAQPVKTTTEPPAGREFASGIELHQKIQVHELPPEQAHLHREVLTCNKLEARSCGKTVVLPDNAEIWITDDSAGLAAGIARQLEQKNYRVRLVTSDRIDKLEASELAGLIIVSPPGKLADSFLTTSFRILQKAGAKLRSSGTRSGAVFATISRLDGAFGLRSMDAGHSEISGGLAGFAKTAHLEWPEVTCIALDVDRDLTDYNLIGCLVVEEIFTRESIEVGITSEGRFKIETVPEDLPTGELNLPFEKEDVIIITGGARGVTAECAIKLAEAGSQLELNMVLLGRSASPTPDPDWMRDLHDEQTVKKQILQRAELKLTPRQVEEQYQSLMSNREVHDTLSRIEAAGGKVFYRSVDVRDLAALYSVLDDVRNSIGPIRGLIHGAGVLADKLILDKSPNEFEKVYATKAGGLMNLLEELHHDTLRAVVLFSSSTGRYGRIGQVDYAVANEVLNKGARRLAALHPECKVLSMNWGPWDGGMVTPSLRKIFESEGIGIIPLKAGAEYLARELSVPGTGPVEVVIIGKLPGETPFEIVEVPKGMTIVLEKKLTVRDYPLLQSHVINGKAVVPVAMIVEQLAHGAVHGNPGFLFAGFNNLRVFRGLKLDAEQECTYRIMAGKMIRRDSYYVIPIELHTSFEGSKFLHNAAADILLANKLSAETAKFAGMSFTGYPFGNEEIYKEFLFHGDALQGILKINGCSYEGIQGEVKTAPSPEEFIGEPFRGKWIADPLALDCSFQMMILWSFNKYNSASLPCYIGTYRQYRAFPKNRVKVTAVVTKDSNLKAVADIEFTDFNGDLVARIEDYECTIDSTLREAFTRNKLLPGIICGNFP
ncbi:MAG: SDR family NAD(P)-dependent oxidoreductase [Firmicutes bacterium]|nr:SDR family NAD(P)-dependent oxidoreductase [Bacillota bacterium]